MSDDKPTPIADSFTAIPIPTDIPPDTITIAGQAKTDGDTGVTVNADVDVGKPGGWDVGVQASWWQRAGASIMGWARWSKKKS